MTDGHGIVNLGKLPLVRSINYLSGNIERDWTIDQTNERYSYDKVIYAFPGETVTLPVSQNWSVKDIFLLQRTSEGERNDETHHVLIKDGKLSFIVQ